MTNSRGSNLRSRPTQRFPRFLSNLPIQEEEEEEREPGVIWMGQRTLLPFSTVKLLPEAITTLNDSIDETEEDIDAFWQGGTSHFMRAENAEGGFDLWRSTDKTLTWAIVFASFQTAGSAPSMQTGFGGAIWMAYFPGNDPTIRVAKSDNNGESWVVVANIAIPIFAAGKLTIACHPANANILAVLSCTDWDDDDLGSGMPWLAVSQSAGASWTADYLTNLPDDFLVTNTGGYWENMKFSEDGRLTFFVSCEQRSPSPNNPIFTESGITGNDLEEPSEAVFSLGSLTDVRPQIWFIYVNTNVAFEWIGFSDFNGSDPQLVIAQDSGGRQLQLYTWVLEEGTPSGLGARTLDGGDIGPFSFEAYAMGVNENIDINNPILQTSSDSGTTVISLQLNVLAHPRNVMFSPLSVTLNPALEPPVPGDHRFPEDHNHYEGITGGFQTTGFVYQGDAFGYLRYPENHPFGINPDAAIAVEINTRRGPDGLQRVYSDSPMDLASYQTQAMNNYYVPYSNSQFGPIQTGNGKMFFGAGVPKNVPLNAENSADFVNYNLEVWYSPDDGQSWELLEVLASEFPASGDTITSDAESEAGDFADLEGFICYDDFDDILYAAMPAAIGSEFNEFVFRMLQPGPGQEWENITEDFKAAHSYSGIESVRDGQLARYG